MPIAAKPQLRLSCFQQYGGGSMRRLFAFATVLLLAAPAWADFDDGWVAYERGDYGTAFEEWLPPFRSSQLSSCTMTDCMSSDQTGD